MSVEELVYTLPDLPIGERARIREQVERDHPDLLPLLQDMERLAKVLDVARTSSYPVSDSFVAGLLLDKSLGTLTPIREKLWESLNAHLEQYPELRERVESLNRRMDHLAEHAGVAFNPNLDILPPAPSRGAVRLRKLVTRAAFVAASVALFLWGVSLSSSRERADELGQVAMISSNEADGRDFLSTVRSSESTAPALTDTEALFLEGLAQLSAARKTTLGFFPRYDLETLRLAEQHFQRVVDEAPAGSYLSYEAAFWLARTRAGRGDLRGAIRMFEYVAEGGGARAPQASEFLARLRRYEAQLTQ